MTKAEFIKKYKYRWHEEWQCVEAAASVTDCPELAAAGKACEEAGKKMEELLRKMGVVD